MASTPRRWYLHIPIYNYTPHIAPIAAHIYIYIIDVGPNHQTTPFLRQLSNIFQVSRRELKITTATMRMGNFRTSLTRVTLPRPKASSPRDVFGIYFLAKPKLKTYAILQPQKNLTLYTVIRNWKKISKTDHVCNLMTAKACDGQISFQSARSSCELIFK